MEETQPINLNISDIADAVKIIDFAFEQGAFKGVETIRQIMIIRDRLDLFIKATSTTVTPDQQDSLNNLTSELT